MADRTVSVRLQAQITDYMAKFSAAGKAAEDLAGRVDRAKGRTAQGFQTIGRTALVAGGAVVAGFGYAIKQAAEFDAKMALVKTLSHATSDEMAQLHDAALTVGQAYGFTADQVADAEAELVKAGISVKDVLGGALTGALTLAAAGQTNVAEATEIAATAMTQFQLQGKDVPHIADLLAAGADKALGSVGDLGYALDQSGLTAHQFGVSIEETVGTLAAFAQAGQVGERGGTVFAQVLARLAAPGKQASDVMKTLGLNVYDTNGQFVGMAGLADQLHNKMSNLTLAERNHDLQVIFGQRAIRGANILYQEGAKGIEKWTAAVNDQGFAALQAAGKMDSLSGDVTKLHSALQEAFIGVGEGASGPLRTLVQDVTKVVDAWNELPGPVKTGAEALIFAGGAAAVLGGAAIVLIPKIQATRLALDEMGVSASVVSKKIGRGGAFVTAAGAAALAIIAIEQAAQKAHYDTAAIGDDLIYLAQGFGTGADLAKAFGDNLDDLGSKFRLAADQGVSVFGLQFHSLGATLTHTGSDFSNARSAFESVDSALSKMVQNGSPQLAARAFDRLTEAARRQGVSVDDLAKLFPEYRSALQDQANAQDTVATATYKLAASMKNSASATEDATQAAKDYNAALKALTDPVFGLYDALSSLRGAQENYDKAVKENGANSQQAKDALIAVAKAATDVNASATTLSTAMQTGASTTSDMENQLRIWVRQGQITSAEAKDIAAQLGIVYDKAHRLDGLTPTVNVHANTARAKQALDDLNNLLTHIAGMVVHPTVEPHGLKGLLGGAIPGQATGGPVYGPGSGTSDSVLRRLSNGEFIVRSDGSNLSDAYRYFSARSTHVAGPTAGPTVTYQTTVINPEPEKASESVPRALREAAYVSGNAW